MTTAYIDPTRQAAQQSYWGQNLTQSQFDTFWPMTEIMNRTIRHAGSFTNELTDFAHAAARNERMDAVQAETIIRDLYKIRFGETLNQTRENLLENEQKLGERAQDLGLTHANRALYRAKEQPMRSYLAIDREAVDMAAVQGISETGAKKIMADAHEKTLGRSLYDAGKELDETHYRPFAEAERAQRKNDAVEKKQAMVRSR